MKRYKPTLAEQWAIKAMLLRRYPNRTIQQAFGISRTTVLKIMAEMPFLPKGRLATKTILGIRTSLEKRVEEMILSRKHKTLTAIAEEAGCSRERVSQIAAELGDNYYSKENQRLREKEIESKRLKEKLEKSKTKLEKRLQRIAEIRELWNNPAISTKEFARRTGFKYPSQAIKRIKEQGLGSGFLKRSTLMTGKHHPNSLKEDDVKLLSELWLSGMTYKKIGEKLGLSWTTLQSRVYSARRHFPELFPIRAAFGNKSVPVEEIETLKGLLLEKLSVREIALRLGQNHWTIASRIRRYNLRDS